MILIDADELREALRVALQERDEARAEHEVLRQDAVRSAIAMRDALDRLEAVAERQRQACADYMAEQRWYTTLACLSAPLVTDRRGEP